MENYNNISKKKIIIICIPIIILVIFTAIVTKIDSNAKRREAQETAAKELKEKQELETKIKNTSYNLINLPSHYKITKENIQKTDSNEYVYSSIHEYDYFGLISSAKNSITYDENLNLIKKEDPIISEYIDPHLQNRLRLTAQNMISKSLKDPSSAEFYDFDVYKRTDETLAVNVSVRANNSFGAKVVDRFHLYYVLKAETLHTYDSFRNTGLK